MKVNKPYRPNEDKVDNGVWILVGIALIIIVMCGIACYMIARQS